jgi:WD40 repeat protein
MLKKIISFALFGIMIFSHIKLLASDNIYWYQYGFSHFVNFYYSNMSCCYLPKTNRIVATTYNDRIKVYEMNTNKLINIITDDCLCGLIDVSPDERYIVNFTYGVYDIETGQRIRQLDTSQFPQTDYPYPFKFSPDGSILVRWNDDFSLRINDFYSGKIKKNITCTKPIKDFAINSKNQIYYIDYSTKLHIYDIVNDTILNISYDSPFSAFEGYLTISPDDKYLALTNRIASDSAGSIQILNTNSFENIINYPVKGLNSRAVFAKNDSYFIYSLDSNLIFVNITENNSLVKNNNKIGEIFKRVQCVMYPTYLNVANDGKSIVLFNHKNWENRYHSYYLAYEPLVDIYNVEEDKMYPAVFHGGKIVNLAFSNDNNYLYVQETGRLEEMEYLQKFSMIDKKRIWMTSSDYSATIPVGIYGDSNHLHSLVISKNDSLIATTSQNNYINIIDTRNGKIIKKLYVGSVPFCLSFSPNNRYIACGSNYGRLKIWDLYSFNLINEIDLRETNDTENNIIYIINFNNNEEIYCAFGDDRIRNIVLVNFLTGKIISRPVSDNSDFSAISQLNNLYKFSNYNNFLSNRVWKESEYKSFIFDIKNLKSTYLEDTLETQSCDFSQDEKLFATGFFNGNFIKIWDLINWKEIANYNYNNFIKILDQMSYPGTDSTIPPILSVCFSPNGKYIAGGNYDGSVIIWENTLTGVNDIPKTNNNFEIYPNPANNIFKLKYNSDVETQIQLSIYDYLGNEVLSLSEPCVASANEKTVDCSCLSTGYYLVKVRFGEIVQTQGLVILK